MPADHDDVYVGLDVGTQSARAFAVAGDGTVLGRGAVALAGRREGNRHEQAPGAWWEAVAEASREALADVDRARVRAVATCATSGTILLVGEDGEPLTPGVMYDDMRAVEQAARIARSGGLGGRRVAPEWALPKLLWMLDAWPGFEREGRLAHQADLVTRALAGHAVPSDSSHALKSGYDLEREEWPRPALDGLGVPFALLPEVVRPGTQLGEVCEAAARHAMIPAGTPVIAGMTDGCASQLAAGALREGDWNSVLGTTLVLKGASAERIEDPAGVLYSHRAPDGMWLPGGASSSGAGALTRAFPDGDLDDLGKRAAAHDTTTVLDYPLVQRGERFPFAAPAAQPFVAGEPAGDAEHFAALLQGVAFVERLCFDLLDRLDAPIAGRLTLTGGGTRSRRWSELRADVLGREVRLVEHAEAAFGMAVLAAASVGGGDLAAAASAMVRTRAVIEPRPQRREPLLESHLRFVAELEHRGWLDAALAQHARLRAGA